MKKLIILFDFFVLVFSIQLCVPCSAETPPSSKVEGTSKQGKIDPAVRQEIFKRYDRFRKFSPVERERIRKNWQEYKRMSPQEHQKIQKNFKEWKNMSPEEGRKFKINYEHWRKLTPEQKEHARKVHGKH